MYRPEPKIVIENEQEIPYTPYIAMEDLIDKLKLLNYDMEFVKELKMKPLNRHYFVVPKNPGEQFHLFASLAAWLARKRGQNFDQPQEYDDPNSTIATILNQVRELGVTVDFPPNKLKQGVGEHAIFVLDQLADAALKATSFEWQKPTPLEEKDPETDIIDDEAELILDRVEEEMAAAYSDESDEEHIFHVDDLIINKKHNKTEENNKVKSVLNNVDQESWRLELEKVLPQLKVTIKSDSRDWRSHLEQMRTHRKGIEDVLAHTRGQLDKLHGDISSTLEKIDSREKHLNRDLEPVLDKYRVLQDELSKLQDNYKNISGGVTERTRELAKLSDQLESVKQQMEERGSSMTDGTPLVNIRKGMTRIKAEITEMDVRIGVLESMLLQSRLREAKLLEEDLANPLSAR
ncbi:Intraflagellar transport 57 [Carabus blaptoides fortunei]